MLDESYNVWRNPGSVLNVTIKTFEQTSAFGMEALSYRQLCVKGQGYSCHIDISFGIKLWVVLGQEVNRASPKMYMRLIRLAIHVEEV